MTFCSGPWASAWPRRISRLKSSTSMPSRPPTKPSSSANISTSFDSLPRSRGRVRVGAATTLLDDWQTIPAVDHHCHPLRRWPFQLTAVELRGAFSEALDPQLAQGHVMHSVAYQDAIRRIAGEVGCEATEAAILAQRNAAEPGSYARRLLPRTATAVMLVDNGFVTAESLTLAEQEQALGIKQRQIIRLETVAEGLITGASDPREWFRAVRAELRA